MKNFLKKILLFTLPLLLVAAFLELAARKVPNDYALKRALFDDQSKETEVLILGSSHTYFGINPDWMTQKALNAANVSQTLNVDACILEQFFADAPNLQAVILPISAFSLFTRIEETSEAWRCAYYAIYQDIHLTNNFQYQFEILSLAPNSFITKLRKYYLRGRNPLISSPTGWGSTFRSEYALELDDTGATVAKAHTSAPVNSLSRNKTIIEQIADQLNQRDIQLVLLTTPTHSSYYNHLDQYHMQLTEETCREIETQLPNTHYINLQTNSSFSPSDFYDANHLNNLGAKKLSEKLSQLLNSLITP